MNRIIHTIYIFVHRRIHSVSSPTAIDTSDVKHPPPKKLTQTNKQKYGQVRPISSYFCYILRFSDK